MPNMDKQSLAILGGEATAGMWLGCGVLASHTQGPEFRFHLSSTAKNKNESKLRWSHSLQCVLKGRATQEEKPCSQVR
jgi:hypothetical protein